MKLKIKKVYLRNYCGYRELEFDFTKNDKCLNSAVFFGPNGSGKSTLLNAIRMLSSPYQNMAKDTSLAFRKITFHPDYDPDYQDLKDKTLLEPSNKMHLEGIFETEEGDKRVVIETDGVKVCEIPKQTHGHSYYIDADHPMNMRKFQIHEKYLKDFIDMAEIVYGMKVNVAKKVGLTFQYGDMEIEDNSSVYTDFIIHKQYAHEPTTKVHFKSMSDGERKIATLLSYLYDPCYIDDREIILIDNIEMHIYFKRHSNMFDKFLSSFPDKQIICTTHSQTLIDHVGKTYGKECLYDLDILRDKFNDSRSDSEMKDREKLEKTIIKNSQQNKKLSPNQIF